MKALSGKHHEYSQLKSWIWPTFLRNSLKKGAQKL